MRLGGGEEGRGEGRGGGEGRGEGEGGEEGGRVGGDTYCNSCDDGKRTCWWELERREK